jgi:hypothetical protein
MAPSVCFLDQLKTSSMAAAEVGGDHLEGGPPQVAEGEASHSTAPPMALVHLQLLQVPGPADEVLLLLTLACMECGGVCGSGRMRATRGAMTVWARAGARILSGGDGGHAADVVGAAGRGMAYRPPMARPQKEATTIKAFIIPVELFRVELLIVISCLPDSLQRRIRHE